MADVVAFVAAGMATGSTVCIYLLYYVNSFILFYFILYLFSFFINLYFILFLVLSC